jgi:hypothetical protein
MADLGFGMVLAQDCQSGKLAVAVPGGARPARVERRVERFLSNDRIDPQEVWHRMARSFLAGWASGPILMILVEPPNHNDLRCLKVTLAYRKRALPPCSPATPPAARTGRCPRRSSACSAGWPPARDEPWLLVSSRHDGPRLSRRYTNRTWTEALFRDEESSAFRWGESHVDEPVHARG